MIIPIVEHPLALTVRCPRCWAQPGHGCSGTRGVAHVSTHKARIKSALKGETNEGIVP